MEVDCEGCAGCCLDWRALGGADRYGRSPREPLSDAGHVVPLARDEVVAFLEAGYGDALVPRLFVAAADDASVVVDGHELAALDGRPLFLVSLRALPKPVAPFGMGDEEGDSGTGAEDDEGDHPDDARVWLPTCAFLDPDTLQCRIHDDELYPETCATYPGTNLLLGRETECERVEAVYGGRRLLDDDAPADATPLFGPAAIGSKVFAYPDDDLAGRVARIADGEPTAADRAAFVGAAVGSAPGSLDVDRDRAAEAREQVLAADSWVSAAESAWGSIADDPGDAAAGAPPGDDVEDARGAPPTPGWDAVDDG